MGTAMDGMADTDRVDFAHGLDEAVPRLRMAANVANGPIKRSKNNDDNFGFNFTLKLSNLTTYALTSSTTMICPRSGVAASSDGPPKLTKSALDSVCRDLGLGRGLSTDTEPVSSLTPEAPRRAQVAQLSPISEESLLMNRTPFKMGTTSTATPKVVPPDISFQDLTYYDGPDFQGDVTITVNEDEETHNVAENVEDHEDYEGFGDFDDDSDYEDFEDGKDDDGDEDVSITVNLPAIAQHRRTFTKLTSPGPETPASHSSGTSSAFNDFTILRAPTDEELCTARQQLTSGQCLTGDAVNSVIHAIAASTSAVSRDIFVAHSFWLRNENEVPAWLALHAPHLLRFSVWYIPVYHLHPEHWTLAVVDRKKSSTPFIRHYDSLPNAMATRSVANRLRRYLTKIYGGVLGSNFMETGSVQTPSCPVQADAVSCGVHMLWNIQELLSNQELSHRNFSIDAARQQLLRLLEGRTRSFPPAIQITRRKRAASVPTEDTTNRMRYLTESILPTSRLKPAAEAFNQVLKSWHDFMDVAVESLPGSTAAQLEQAQRELVQMRSQHAIATEKLAELRRQEKSRMLADIIRRNAELTDSESGDDTKESTQQWYKLIHKASQMKENLGNGGSVDERLSATSAKEQRKDAKANIASLASSMSSLEKRV
ncbi:uncharacterized protein CTRU02_215744 [Colletotrichum truncatum]|uniref:Uncharacterized protein n=1 Tax=Colletotrichum truncatum TaxID=5467 RepID=A0ACC3YBR3_COLTU